MSNNFGEILKKIRKEKGLTGLELSKELGISQSALNKIETGKRKRIDLDLVSRICQVLEIDANQLFGVISNQNPISNNKEISMSKLEELEMVLIYMKKKFQELALQDKRIYEIIDVLDSFDLNTKPINGRIQMFFRNEIISGGNFQENEMVYALFLMSFFCQFNYKCRKVALKIQQPEYEVAIDTLLMSMRRIIRNQATWKIKPNEDFKTKKFYEEFKSLIKEAVNALGHKYDNIGCLTDSYIPKEAEELKHIRAIYEKITFKSEKIKYYDYIAEVYRYVDIYNTVEIQYMIMNLYTKAYAESVLWLKKEDPSCQWCPATPWQILVKLKIMIPKYFLYESRRSQ